MHIIGSAFSVTGEDSSRHNKGTVLVEFNDEQVATFDDVREDMFERWAESDYDPELVPVDMRDAWREYAERMGEEVPEETERIQARQQPISDEELLEIEYPDDEEDEETDEDEETSIHPLDFLGQATGIPTQGFVAPVIADDDYLGQYTGFPTPGHNIPYMIHKRK